MDDQPKKGRGMYNDKEQKPITPAGNPAEDTVMDRKILALKKAIKDLFTPTNPHHIGVEHYYLHPATSFREICSEDWAYIIKAIKNKINGLSPEGIENQTPAMDRLGYGQSLLEVIDEKHLAEDKIVKPVEKYISEKNAHESSVWDYFADNAKRHFSEIKNIISVPFDALSPPPTPTAKKPEIKPGKTR